MRPSSNPEVAFILDRKVECQVIDDAFSDIDFVRNNEFFDPKIPSSAQGTKIRFEAEAKTQAKPIEMPSTGRLVLSPITGKPIIKPESVRSNPNFEVRYEDLHFVQKATERVLSERNPSRKLQDRLSGRYSAAATILVAVARILNNEIAAYNALDYHSD